MKQEGTRNKKKLTRAFPRLVPIPQEMYGVIELLQHQESILVVNNNHFDAGSCSII